MALPISSTPTIRPAPTLLTTAPFAFAKDGRHDIDDTAFDAGTTLETAVGREGGHFVLSYPGRCFLGRKGCRVGEDLLRIGRCLRVI